jgi:NTE family protein
MTTIPPLPGRGSCGPRIALALGGGSARGLAHVVILEAFDELGIKPSIIAGTSMGAICGAAYAAGLSAAQLREHCEELFADRARFLRRMAKKLRGGFTALWSLRAPSVVDNVTLFEMLLPDALRCDFAALKIPFLAVAADFYANSQVILDTGPVIPALAASSALPALSRPVLREGRVLIDGGYVNPLPYDVVMTRAELTVAVDVTCSQLRPAADAKTAVPGTLQLLAGATQMLFCALTREKLKSTAPDVLVRPSVAAFAPLDYFRIAEIFAAAIPAKQELKSKLLQWLATAR